MRNMPEQNDLSISAIAFISIFADGKENQMMKIEKLYRYPVKGLSPEEMKRVELEAGATMPLDRAWAIENGPGKFDPSSPRHLPKINFIMLMRNERLAALRTRLDDESHELVIEYEGKIAARGNLDEDEGRRAIEEFMTSWVPAEQLRGAPKIYSARGHSFSDVADKCLHIINLESLKELEKLAGEKIDPLRFRANLLISGAEPFSELEWLGKILEFEGSSVRLEPFKRTERCPATNVDPQSGERDMSVPELLYEHFGHRDFGVYAHIEHGGVIRTGDGFSIA
jgi:uncharacterized protein YcbX